MDYCGNTAVGYHVAKTAYAVSASDEEVHVIPSALWILGCIQEQRVEDKRFQDTEAPTEIPTWDGFLVYYPATNHSTAWESDWKLIL